MLKYVHVWDLEKKTTGFAVNVVCSLLLLFLLMSMSMLLFLFLFLFFCCCCYSSFDDAYKNIK